MTNKAPFIRQRLAILFCLSTVLFASGAYFCERRASAQATRPILISQEDSTRAIALESVSRVHEPFQLNTKLPFSTDRRTRIVLFALNLQPYDDASSLTMEAEDGAHNVYPLRVENVAPVPGQEWMYAITARLSDEMGDVGDLLVRVNYQGVSSNRVRVAIGHVGGGLADDAGSIPTPAPPTAEPTPNTNPVTAGNLTTDDVRTVIAQAVSAAVAMNRAVTVAVTDREGNVLGVFSMTGAPSRTQFRGGTGFSQNPNIITGLVPVGLEGTNLPPLLNPVRRAAVSKAGTAAFFSTFGNAFTPRTASFIIQEHFPPGVDNQSSGPLYGVQFSQLDCSDIKRPGLPFGLSGDPGGVPLYKNGVPSGGVGIEGDGIYTIDRDPADFDKPFEEVIAMAAERGYEPPPLIRGDNILANGIRLAYVNVTDADVPRVPTMPFASLPGTIDPAFPIRGAQPSAFVPASVGGVNGSVDLRFFPFVGSMSGSANALTAADVDRILGQAARQADKTRAAIRQPLGSAARVNIAVVDTEGRVLGIFRTTDAPVFGFDVSVQKARTAAFFSRNNAGALLRSAGFGNYVDRAAADGLRMDGSVAITDRANGFLHRPFYPDGINNTAPGPFSPSIDQWSVFSDGLQIDLIKANLEQTITFVPVPGLSPPRCSTLPNVANGLQIFPGSVPLYKNGELVGAIGISGDGVDQDDIIGSAGSAGYAAPPEIRADQVFVRGIRLPYVKFPRSPNL